MPILVPLSLRTERKWTGGLWRSSASMWGDNINWEPFLWQLAFIYLQEIVAQSWWNKKLSARYHFNTVNFISFLARRRAAPQILSLHICHEPHRVTEKVTAPVQQSITMSNSSAQLQTGRHRAGDPGTPASATAVLKGKRTFISPAPHQIKYSSWPFAKQEQWLCWVPSLNHMRGSWAPIGHSYTGPEYALQEWLC